jgi:hypothetical protein
MAHVYAVEHISSDGMSDFELANVKFFTTKFSAVVHAEKLIDELKRDNDDYSDVLPVITDSTVTYTCFDDDIVITEVQVED